MTFVDRYQAVGLERNPFSTQALVDTDVFVDRGLSSPPPPGSCTMVQVIGDRGYGKSTHLRHWRSIQPGPHHYIPLEPYRQRWSAPPRAKTPGTARLDGVANNITVYGDEIDRMPSLLRRWWFRDLAAAGATLVIGTHVDLAAIARHAGFAVFTHHLAPLTRVEMQELAEQRLRAASLNAGTHIKLSAAELDELFATSSGVPREFEELCHRLLADRVV